VDIRQKESSRRVENVTCGLLEKKPLAFSMDKDEILLTFEMEHREVKCLQVTWKNALREIKEGEEVNRSQLSYGVKKAL
jgi:hypothetical protein